MLWAVGLAGWLTACSTEPKPPAELPAVTLEEELEIASPEPLGPPANPPAPDAPRPSRPAPMGNWTPLANYCRDHGAVVSRLSGSATNNLLFITGPAGQITLRSDSRIGEWQGVRFWMAYGPKTIDQLPYVHRLDADKNLRPLLQPPPLSPTSRRILIDAGHGGSNRGTRNPSGDIVEKELTLDWAFKLQHLLEERGWTVFLTRRTDKTLSLSDRVGMAEQVRAALFLSLHFNSAAPNPTRSGIETYCLTPAGLPSTLVRYAPEEKDRVYPNNRHDTANFQLALSVHRALIRETAAVDRGVRRARFMTVLQGQKRPAVLIEAGFLSTPEEAEMINQSVYRQRLAEAVAVGLDPWLLGAGAEP